MRSGSYFALFLAVASTALAQTPVTGLPGDSSKEAAEAQAFRHLQVPGSKVSRAVRKVRKLKWFSSLAAASQRARLENKPIVWIQALGTLKGQT
jgi:hypothetical protein